MSVAPVCIGDGPVAVVAAAAALEPPIESKHYSEEALANNFRPTNILGETYRNYENSSRQSIVEANYKRQHENMTVERVRDLHKKWLEFNHGEYTIMEILHKLDDFVDESDPDVDIPNSLHAFMTAEAIRKLHPDKDWLWLTGFLHDLGKVMSCWGEEQWCVVGDTFPVGCEFSKDIVLAHQFEGNPDFKHPVYSTPYGMYQPHCGLDNVLMAFGHDEYLYQVLNNHTTCSLPIEGLWCIRYHSFYPWHDKGAYQHLMAPEDDAKLRVVNEFNKFDLYSKGDDLPNVDQLEPLYQSLIDKYGLGGKIRW
ncbi:hypothetical protein FOL47_002704 [Perkinsus chesapeaki]|uniref:Inositol oxygenase n=1 Tax=Perkinsus chesapeaki TaxID=330153 RepID=A0A7J6MDS1_PERCH|nr:hypothetical protein FOL47_002704 [Perkinsus chesapeaki]